MFNLLLKLDSKLRYWQFSQVLQLLFIWERPNHGAAVSFREKCFKQASDPILGLNWVGETFGLFECGLQILFGGDLSAILITELKGEVADDPSKAREDSLVLLWVALLGLVYLFELDVLGQVND